MTTRDIQAHLQELYGVEVSPTLISNVTEAVMDEVRQWQMRPLEAIYPIVYFDCLLVNLRVLKKALYLVLAVNLDGQKELLGMWIAQTGDEILVVGALRGAEPRRQGYLYCVCGWAHRLARSH